MVVEFDGVGLQSKAYPAPFPALLAVDGDLAVEGMVQFAAEAMHDVAGPQHRDGGGHEVVQDRCQCRAVGEQHVSGVFALVNDPPIARNTGRLDIRKKWIEQSRLTIEESRPVGVSKTFTKCLDGIDVFDPGDLVVATPVLDPGPVHLSRQTVSAIHVDLDFKGRPGL